MPFWLGVSSLFSFAPGLQFYGAQGRGRFSALGFSVYHCLIPGLAIASGGIGGSFVNNAWRPFDVRVGYHRR